jgi:surfeit locus 1 family protein
LHKADYPVNTPVSPDHDRNAAVKHADSHVAQRSGASGSANLAAGIATRGTNGLAYWAILIFTLVGVAVTVVMGTWQLRRADFKETLSAQTLAQAQLPALQNAALIELATQAVNTKTKTADLVLRSVQLRGTWLHEHTAWLDNRFMTGRPGFYVVTPLQLTDSQAVVWVQRGWVARDVQDRTRLPELPTPSQAVVVQGKLIDGISRIYALGDENAAAAPASAPGAARASRIWQNLPMVTLTDQQRWLSVTVLQTASEQATNTGDTVPTDGLQRQWPQADAGVAKHYGYAFQWFALGALIIGLYVWFQILSPRRSR